MKQYYFMLFLIFPFLLKAQGKRKFLYSTLKSKSTYIANAHVQNLKTGIGTFSNDQGNFRILSKENDSLKITYVGYETKIVIVSNHHFGIQKNVIKLNKATITLDEVEVKKHNLIGILSRDMKQTPEDIGNTKSRGAIDFSMINFKEPTIKIVDEFSRKKAPDARRMTDPTAKFAGLGSSFSGIDKYGVQLRKLRKKISFKENFPKMLLSEFGEHFFFHELKIPKENYYHFLEYCNSFNIEKLYKNNKTIEVINILQNKSKNYLLIINKTNE